MTTTIVLIGLGSLVVLLLLGALLMPSKSSSSNQQAFAPPLQAYAEPVQRGPDWSSAIADLQLRSNQSLRDREIDEDAAALAGEFRRVKNERYLASLRADAAEYFATSPGAKKTAS